MLKRPQRKAKETASPVRISEEVKISVCWKLYAELLAVDVFHQNQMWCCVNGMSMW